MEQLNLRPLMCKCIKIAFILFLNFVVFHAYSESVLKISDPKTPQLLEPFAEYFDDPTTEMTVNEVVKNVTLPGFE